jgi:hypothetical protein
MTEATPIDLTIPAIDIRLQIPIDDGTNRMLTFGTIVPQHVDDSQLNALLDKLSRASERLRAQTMSPTHENILAEKREALIFETQRLYKATVERDEMGARIQQEATANGRRGEPRLTPQQRNAHVQLEATIADSTSKINTINKDISSLEKLVAMYKARIGEGA